MDHDILLQKLWRCGIRGITLSWFSSYLKGRYQRVRIKNTLSSSKHIQIGVPQGAVLSATLFIIFLNDLLRIPFKGTISAFADDVALRYSDVNWNNIWKNMNIDLIKLNNWCKNNYMVINANKTKFINFDYKRFSFEQLLKLHNGVNCLEQCKCPVIEQVDHIKYLGIIIDENVSWKHHAQLLQLQLRLNIRKFYFLRKLVSEETLKTLYFALIHSRLIYGIELWGGANITTLNPLKVLQKFFIRILTFKNKRESALPLFRMLNILPLKYLFLYKVLKIFYVRSGNIGTERLGYNTRSVSQGHFTRPKVNKVLYRNSLLFLGPKVFNLVPKDIKLSPNINVFLKDLKSWLLGKDDINDLLSVIQ